NIDYNLESFLMFSAWCRQINWPPTIKAVMDEGLYPRKRIDWRRVGKLVDQLSRRGKAWTGAYQVRAPTKLGQKKGRFVAEVVVGENFRLVLPELVAVLSRSDSTYQEAHKIVMSA